MFKVTGLDQSEFNQDLKLSHKIGPMGQRTSSQDSTSIFHVHHSAPSLVPTVPRKLSWDHLGCPVLTALALASAASVCGWGCRTDRGPLCLSSGPLLLEPPPRAQPQGPAGLWFVLGSWVGVKEERVHRHPTVPRDWIPQPACTDEDTRSLNGSLGSGKCRLWVKAEKTKMRLALLVTSSQRGHQSH